MRHARVCAALRAGDLHGLDLPDRLSLFGHTRLPETEIDLLVALAGHREVHLWLAQPSAALWDAVLAAGAEVRPRATESSADLAHHPLLASLGRDSRESATVLGARVATGEARDAGSAPEPDAPDTLLGWLQGDLRANAAPDAATRAGRVLAGDDRSVQVHACHGPARQVDVLREVLVGLLEDDPTLEPRDIVVMCPDIETYAPLVSAGFGLGGRSPTRAATTSSTPRTGCGSGSQTARPAAPTRCCPWPSRSSSLAGGRATASQVIDLLSRAVCRRRFGFGDDDLARITRWVAEAGVRWGIDGTQRAAYAMEQFEHNTWRAGIDRLLLGVAMSGDGHRNLGRGLPVDDVASGEIESGRPPRRGRGAARRLPGRAGPGPGRRGSGSRPSRPGCATCARSRTTTPGRLPQAGARAWPGPAPARRRARPVSRSGWPTCGPSCRPGSPDGRPAPTSAPARSPSAPWSRCAPCRTGWSA
ncbi:exodeoxyribonuclease V subunit gamma [Nocardioides convexus]|uniref:exodeoxyribonuclease V subunit gamma n=1 Tax=Nocardioides convexus TaxID=2712224 RepID=UPI0031011ED5